MISPENDVESPRDVPPGTLELHRERVVVRRRRSGSRRHRSGTWAARNSRRRAVRAYLVCAGVLVLMAIGLYFGLSRQNSAPAESLLDSPATAAGRVLA